MTRDWLSQGRIDERMRESATSGELSPAWEREIQDRLQQAETGVAAELIAGDDVFRAIEAELRARRVRR